MTTRKAFGMKKIVTLVLAVASLGTYGGTDAKRVLFIGSDGMSAAILRRAERDIDRLLSEKK